ncbi:MAG: hypothetical protein ABI243_11215, partial [Lapillicoccus sp.]
FVWGYAIIWALASDRVKLLAYRILDPATTQDLATSSTSAPPEPAAIVDATGTPTTTRRSGRDTDS